MSYNLSFSEDFFTGDTEVENIHPSRRPTSILQALISMAHYDRKEFDVMLEDVMGESYAKVWAGKPVGETVWGDILDKARKVDTCRDLRSPVEVYLDNGGHHTVEVYDTKKGASVRVPIADLPRDLSDIVLAAAPLSETEKKLQDLLSEKSAAIVLAAGKEFLASASKISQKDLVDVMRDEFYNTVGDLHTEWSDNDLKEVSHAIKDTILDADYQAFLNKLKTELTALDRNPEVKKLFDAIKEEEKA